MPCPLRLDGLSLWDPSTSSFRPVTQSQSRVKSDVANLSLSARCFFADACRGWMPLALALLSPRLGVASSDVHEAMPGPNIAGAWN